MSNSLDLLRMLEPAVRPGAPTGSGATPARGAGRLPIEDRSFESLLQDVQTQLPGEMQTLSAEPDEAAGGAGTPKTNLLSPLSDLDAVGNASLRELITRNHQPGATTGQHHGN